MHKASEGQSKMGIPSESTATETRAPSEGGLATTYVVLPLLYIGQLVLHFSGFAFDEGFLVAVGIASLVGLYAQDARRQGWRAGLTAHAALLLSTVTAGAATLWVWAWMSVEAADWAWEAGAMWAACLLSPPLLLWLTTTRAVWIVVVAGVAVGIGLYFWAVPLP